MFFFFFFLIKISEIPVRFGEVPMGKKKKNHKLISLNNTKSYLSKLRGRAR